MEEGQCFPLTHHQKRIWYVEQIHPGTSMYNIGGAVRMKGNVDPDILKAAIFKFLENNPDTRIRIGIKEGEPFQYLPAGTDTRTIGGYDFSQKPDPEQSFAQWVVREGQTPFTLLDSRLYAIFICRINPHEIAYFFKFHHIICDGFSAFLMTSQVTENYRALRAKMAPPPVDANRYGELLKAEQKYKDSYRFEKNKNYWNEKFKDLDTLPGIKTSKSIRGCRKNYVLSTELTGRIRRFCDINKISLNTFYTGVLFIYLCKVYRCDTQIIGIPVLNRFGKKERRSFGMYTSTMPLMYKLSEHCSVDLFFANLNREFGFFYLNQKYPYDLLVEDLKPALQGHNPLFHFFVNYYNKVHPVKMDDIRMVNEDFYAGYQIYSLQLVIREWLDSADITLSYDYKAQDYSAAGIEALHQSLNLIIGKITGSNPPTIQDLEILSAADRKHYLSEFNSRSSDYPRQKTITELIEEQALRTPHNIAISCAAEAVTYKELLAGSVGVGAYLRERLEGSLTEVIPVIGEHSIELVTGILGILQAGYAFLPLDPRTPAERLDYILAEVQAEIVVCVDAEKFKNKIKRDLIDLRNPRLFSMDVPAVSSRACGESPAYIIFTSGSTGTPKGVMITHRSLVNYICWAEKEYSRGEDEVFAFYSSIAFDLTITSIFTPLIGGASLRVYDPASEDQGHVLFKILDENKVTSLKLTPSHLAIIKDRDNSQSEIRRLIVGGEDLKVKLALDVHRSFKGDVEIINEYGPTEATVGCMIHRFDPVKDCNASVPIGVPAQNCRIYLLDENLKPVPSGAPGEIFIGGDCLGGGYYKQRELTAERFIPDPYVEDGRLYRTGDLARFINRDCIEYMGRNDDQVKINGYRIELKEIENVILSVPGIEDATVLTCEVNRNQCLCAYLIAPGGPDELGLRNRLSHVLPAYMVPAFFVYLDEFPLTGNGKIDQRKLPAPRLFRENSDVPVEAASEQELVLLEILSEVLGVETVLLTDDFFYLGGDSVKAIQVSSRMKARGYHLKVNSIISNPVLRQMGREMTRESKYHQTETIPCAGEIKNTPVVSWFFGNSFKNPDFYNQSVLLELAAGIGEDVLTRALERIIRYHDILRINYDSAKNGFYYNKRYLTEKFEIQKHDLRSCAEEDRERELRIRGRALKASFKLEEGLLLSAGLFHYTEEKKLLLITAHHVLTDGVSWRILLEDLRLLLQQAGRKEDFTLPGKTVSFAEWAESLKSPAEELAYWKDAIRTDALFHVQASGAPPAMPLAESLAVSPELTKHLLGEANIPYKTKTSELLIIALALALNTLTGKKSFVLELESHGRPHNMDTGRTMGWFTSMYPLKLALPERGGADAHIKALKEQIRGVPGLGTGYGLLVMAGELIPEKKRLIRFNYLGDFTQLDNDFFQLSNLDHGRDIDGINHLTYLLEFNLMVIRGELRISVNYDSRDFTQPFINDLLQKYAENIDFITRHCLRKEGQEFTPSDLKTVALSQEELDGILE